MPSDIIATIRPAPEPDDDEMEQNKAAFRRAEIVDAVRHATTEVERTCVLIHAYDHDKCWMVLGFDSMWDSLKDDLQVKFGMNPKLVFKYAARGRAIAQKAPPGSTMNALDQFAKLNDKPKEQQEAFTAAKEASFTERVTAPAARKAVSRHLPKPRKKVKNLALNPEYLRGINNALAIVVATLAACEEVSIAVVTDIRDEIQRLVEK